MALSVAMQKDIGEYREKIAFGLTAKSLIYLGVACAVGAVEALIAVLLLGLQVMDISILLMATVLAGFLLAYYRPLDMDATAAIPLIWRQYFGKTQLPYITSLSMEVSQVSQDQKMQAEKEMDKKERSDVRKNKARYADERAGRGAKSAEVLLPIIYHAAGGSAEQRGATGHLG